MPEPSDLFRLRLFNGCLKSKVRHDAEDLLNQILKIEDGALKADILRSLIADSLNRFYQADAPLFSHFVIQNALSKKSIKGVGNPAETAEQVQDNGSGNAKSNKKKKVVAGPRSQVIEDKGSQQSENRELEAKPTDEGPSDTFDIDPRFSHLIG